MKTTKLFLAALLIVLLRGAGQADDKFTVTATLDHPDGLYRCGKTACFSLIVKNNEQPVTTGVIHYCLTNDSGKRIVEGEAALGEGPTIIRGTLSEPGFLRLMLTDPPFRTLPNYGQVIGAGFDVEQIQPTAKEPEDFMAWWETQKALVRAIPPDVQLDEVPDKSNAEQTTYKLSLANINGTRQYGWLSVPTKAGKHPALLILPAAGWRPYGPATQWAAQGFLTAVLYAHNFPVDLPPERYDALQKGELARYKYEGRESRETYYFRRVFLGCVRFMDYLMSRPEWDGHNLLVTGSSQGGGLALVCAGLEPKVTAISANVPALCDHTGHLYGRPSGWPQLIPDNDAQIAAVAAYYDAVNFARHAHCASLLSAGFIDSTCPPTTIYAAFSVLPQPKRLFPIPWMGHAQDPKFAELSNRFLLRLGRFSDE